MNNTPKEEKKISKCCDAPCRSMCDVIDIFDPRPHNLYKNCHLQCTKCYQPCGLATPSDVEKKEICGVIVSSNTPGIKDGHACFNIKPCQVHSPHPKDWKEKLENIFNLPLTPYTRHKRVIELFGSEIHTAYQKGLNKNWIYAKERERIQGEVLRDLLNIADCGEIEDLRREVELYAQSKGINLTKENNE